MRKNEEGKRWNGLLQRGFVTCLGKTQEKSFRILPESFRTSLEIVIVLEIFFDLPINLLKHSFDIYGTGYRASHDGIFRQGLVLLQKVQHERESLENNFTIYTDSWLE